jgi:hypothetical protein
MSIAQLGPRRPWQCTCDFCGNLAAKFGGGPGEAADAARNDGFKTVPSRDLSEPSKWACRPCQKAGLPNKDSE